MDKKPSLLTIGEIANMIGITRRIIINYEDHGLIQPDTRGEFDSGYRYYSMDSLVRIRTIRTLQKLGMSLEEIKGYLDGSTDLTPALKRLEALRAELDLSIKQLQERMKDGTKAQIHIAELPEHTVYCKTMRDTTVAQRTTHLRDIAYAAITSHGMDPSKRTYFTQCSMNDPDLITYCAVIPSDRTGADIVHIPQVKALTRYYHGSYENLPAIRKEMLSYAKAHNIRLNGVYRHIFLEGPPQHKDSRNFITMVALLLED